MMHIQTLNTHTHAHSGCCWTVHAKQMEGAVSKIVNKDCCLLVFRTAVHNLSEMRAN